MQEIRRSLFELKCAFYDVVCHRNGFLVTSLPPAGGFLPMTMASRVYVSTVSANMSLTIPRVLSSTIVGELYLPVEGSWENTRLGWHVGQIDGARMQAYIMYEVRDMLFLSFFQCQSSPLSTVFFRPTSKNGNGRLYKKNYFSETTTIARLVLTPETSPLGTWPSLRLSLSLCSSCAPVFATNNAISRDSLQCPLFSVEYSLGETWLRVKILTILSC